jgi:hypothetical protein
MRAVLVLALAVSVASLANAASVDPADVWRPVTSSIGTWKGTRTGANGPVKVTRVYAAATTNHHLEIAETGGGRTRAVEGMVSFDPQRQLLVLRAFDADGSASDLALDPAASTAGQVVFASLEGDAARTRITYERTGAKAFIERIEHAAGGSQFAVVSETRFVRTD